VPRPIGTLIVYADLEPSRVMISHSAVCRWQTASILGRCAASQDPASITHLTRGGGTAFAIEGEYLVDAQRISLNTRYGMRLLLRKFYLDRFRMRAPARSISARLRSIAPSVEDALTEGPRLALAGALHGRLRISWKAVYGIEAGNRLAPLLSHFLGLSCSDPSRGFGRVIAIALPKLL
jgi:hypothetical protein